MSKTIIHLQTVVQTVFAELDEDGNVVKKTPINLEIPRHEEDVFLEALRTLKKVRYDLSAPKGE